MSYKINENCIACGVCLTSCPEKAIKDDGLTEIFVILPEKCTDCGRCVEDCPVKAIVRAR